jgi:small-conductance mechanosensitive channel/CRP-like cAMP-binding protein
MLQSPPLAAKEQPMTMLAAVSLLPNGWNMAWSDLALRGGGLLACYLAFTGAQRFMARSPFLRSVALQLNLLAFALLALAFLGPVLDQFHAYVRAGVQAAALFLCITIGLKLGDLFFFDRLPKWRNKPQVPLVLRDIGRLVLAAVGLVLVVRSFFPGVNLNVLAVSSLVVGYIVGNATQDTLGNLFAGLALNAERPFQIGDWVTVAGHTGQVVDTTWRATRLRTKAEDYIVIPNSAIGKESIVNFSRPTGVHGCYLQIGVSYDTPPNKAREVILSVLREAPEVCKTPSPSVYLINYGNFSIDFKIKFFIEDFARLDRIQSGVLDRLWYAFRREGVSIPYPVQEERFRDHAAEEAARLTAEQESIRALVAGADLFQSLSAEEKHRLALGTQIKPFACGEVLCRQGEAGDSFYVIREGRVAVLVKNEAGQEIPVAHLSNGACFGEMALLTGDPRSATVVAETDVEVARITKPLFAELLKANSELAGKLAVVLEKRAADLQAKKAASGGATKPVETSSALKARILRFFGMQ